MNFKHTEQKELLLLQNDAGAMQLVAAGSARSQWKREDSTTPPVSKKQGFSQQLMEFCKSLPLEAFDQGLKKQQQENKLE